MSFHWPPRKYWGQWRGISLSEVFPRAVAFLECVSEGLQEEVQYWASKKGKREVKCNPKFHSSCSAQHSILRSLHCVWSESSTWKHLQVWFTAILGKSAPSWQSQSRWGCWLWSSSPLSYCCSSLMGQVSDSPQMGIFIPLCKKLLSYFQPLLIPSSSQCLPNSSHVQREHPKPLLTAGIWWLWSSSRQGPNCIGPVQAVRTGDTVALMALQGKERLGVSSIKGFRLWDICMHRSAESCLRASLSLWLFPSLETEICVGLPRGTKEPRASTAICAALGLRCACAPSLINLSSPSLLRERSKT